MFLQIDHQTIALLGTEVGRLIFGGPNSKNLGFRTEKQSYIITLGDYNDKKLDIEPGDSNFIIRLKLLVRFLDIIFAGNLSVAEKYQKLEYYGIIEEKTEDLKEGLNEMNFIQAMAVEPLKNKLHHYENLTENDGKKLEADQATIDSYRNEDEKRGKELEADHETIDNDQARIKDLEEGVESYKEGRNEKESK